MIASIDQAKMKVYFLFLLLCTTLLHHVILSKALTLQQPQDDGAVYDDAIEVKRELKEGKNPYGGANMNRDPRVPKNNAPSQSLWFFRTSVCFSISILLSLGF